MSLAVELKREEEKKEKRMEWWRKAKFGMFIHWGLYSIPAGVWKDKRIPGIGEWIMYRAKIPVKEYEKLTELFNPVKFNAEEWVKIAKEAGMKYMVITAKHHDGFCLFNTRYTDYNVVKATPFGRDPLKELSSVCRKEGMKLGFYYSHVLDWHHPDGMGNDWDYDPAKKDFVRYFRDYVEPQVEELLTNYSPVALLWFDIGNRLPYPELARELRDLVRNLSPDTIINGRIGHGMGDYIEMGDNKIPEHKLEGDWEVPMTLNDTWGYKSYDHNWKTPGRVIQILVEVVSKGGNLLLNVGPTAEGEIPKPAVDILKEVGKWLKVNGESIYGASASPIEVPPDALYMCTAKPGKLFIHVIAWPWYGELKVYDIHEKVRRVYLLATGDELNFTQEGTHLKIKVPRNPPDNIDTVIVLELS